MDRASLRFVLVAFLTIGIPIALLFLTVFLQDILDWLPKLINWPLKWYRQWQHRRNPEDPRYLTDSQLSAYAIANPDRVVELAAARPKLIHTLAEKVPEARPALAVAFLLDRKKLLEYYDGEELRKAVTEQPELAVDCFWREYRMSSTRYGLEPERFQELCNWYFLQFPDRIEALIRSGIGQASLAEFGWLVNQYPLVCPILLEVLPINKPEGYVVTLARADGSLGRALINKYPDFAESIARARPDGLKMPRSDHRTLPRAATSASGSTIDLPRSTN